MKTVACTDINPDTTCDFVATGATTKEAVDAMLKHAKEKHSEDIKGMSDTQVREMIEDGVHDE